MSNFSESWWESLEASIIEGERIGGSSDDFDEACGHIIRLLTDASILLEAGSHATAAFLAITAIEETAKVHIGRSRRSNVSVTRRKDPLYRHSEKHKLALGPTVAMGRRLQAAIGEQRMYELLKQAQTGHIVKIRESALYVAHETDGLVTPRGAVSRETSRELLLLAVEAFDDALVGYTSRSMELSHTTDALFQRWA